MSKRESPSQLVVRQPFDSQSNRYLPSRPHPNRGRLRPKMQRMSPSSNPSRRTDHQMVMLMIVTIVVVMMTAGEVNMGSECECPSGSTTPVPACE